MKFGVNPGRTLDTRVDDGFTSINIRNRYLSIFLH